jgi:hypothetical protein
VLLGTQKVDRDRYERRWLTRLLDERKMSLYEISWTTERLRHIGVGRGQEAGPALRCYLGGD